MPNILYLSYLGGRLVVGFGSSWPHDFRFFTGFFSGVGSGVADCVPVEDADDSGLSDAYGDIEFTAVSEFKSTSSTSHNSLLGVLSMVCGDTISIGNFIRLDRFAARGNLAMRCYVAVR